MTKQGVFHLNLVDRYKNYKCALIAAKTVYFPNLINRNNPWFNNSSFTADDFLKIFINKIDFIRDKILVYNHLRMMGMNSLVL